jgi:hypothetical protein
MFETTKEEMMKKKAEHEARKMLSKMMSQMVLKSDKTPESVKLSIRVMDKAEDIGEALRNFVINYVNPEARANAETLKKVLEYLELVEVGIKQFVETTPFVKDTEEEN